MQYSILAKGDNLCAIVDSASHVFRPFIMKGTDIFDPNNNFKPVQNGKKTKNKKQLKSLSSVFHSEALTLLASAINNWKPPLDPVACEAPVVNKPASALDALIAESVAKIAANDVVNAAKPLIDTFIKNTYGLIPKTLEVHTPKSINIVTGIQHEKFQTVLNLVHRDIPVFLTGPAGSGKNVLCKQVAEALGTEFYFSNAVTQEYKLTGFIDANGHFHETQFFQAFTNGGVFMLDEIDASTPEVLVILNAAIANKYFDFPTGRTTAHEDFRVVAAGNTYGTGADIEYTGRYQLDAASLDRFAIVEIDYSAAIEEALADGNMELVRFVRDFRKAVRDAKIKFIVSYRAIERLNKLEEVFEKADAIQIALLRGLDKEDVRMIAKNMSKDNPYSAEVRKLTA